MKHKAIDSRLSIIDTLEDRALFGSFIKNQFTWTAAKTILKALFNLPMTPADLETYSRLSGGRQTVPAALREAWIIVARRAGKTTMAAWVACYLAIFRDWSAYLSPGERGHIILVATDRKQAGELFSRIRAIFRLRIFRPMVEKELADELQLKGGIVVTVATADFRSLRGYTVLAAILDEAAFFRVEGANPLAEILTALRPAMATIPESLLLVISSPYMRSGPLWETHRHFFGKDDPNTLVIQAATKDLNPTINDSVIQGALAADLSAAKAEWLGQFRDDLETFLDGRMLEAVVIPDRFELPPCPGVKHFGFIDASGGKVDSFTLAIGHREDQRVVLDCIRETVPPFKPVDVVKGYSELLKQYGISQVGSDRYSGEWVSSAFKDCGITCKPSEKPKSDLYLELLPMVAQGRIELLDHPKMLAQLRGLERRTRSGGRDLVDHGPGGHDDLANVTAGAAYLVGSKRMLGPSRIFSEEDFYGPGSEGWDSNHARLLSSMNDY